MSESKKTQNHALLRKNMGSEVTKANSEIGYMRN